MKSLRNPIRSGAIVSCRFPLIDAPDQPGPSEQPALVVGVLRDIKDYRWKIAVARGSTQNTRANTGYEIRLADYEVYSRAGLTRYPRFVLQTMRVLSPDSEFFGRSDGGLTVLGYLNDEHTDRLRKLIEKISGTLAELKIFEKYFDVSVCLPDRSTIDSCACECVDVAKLDDLLRESYSGKSRRQLNLPQMGSVKTS